MQGGQPTAQQSSFCLLQPASAGMGGVTRKGLQPLIVEFMFKVDLNPKRHLDRENTVYHEQLPFFNNEDTRLPL